MAATTTTAAPKRQLSVTVGSQRLCQSEDRNVRQRITYRFGSVAGQQTARTCPRTNTVAFTGVDVANTLHSPRQQQQQQVREQTQDNRPVSILRKRAQYTITGTPVQLTAPRPLEVSDYDDDDTASSSSTASSRASTASPCTPVSDAGSCDTQTTTEKETCATSKAICFYNKVRVFRIPNRLDYPDSMRRSIWGTLQEIHENARRNTIEFAAEGWDWRLATEEEDFVQNTRTGEMMHPVHVERMAAAARRKMHTVSVQART